jgi:hypothetical protein
LIKRTLALSVIFGSAAAPVHAELIFGLLNNDTTAGQRLVTFDSTTLAVTSTVVLGTPSNIGSLSSIDVQPSTGQLFGFSSGTDQLYMVNPTTGALTTVGSPLATGTISGATIAFDPTANVIRLIGTQGGNQNIRLSPSTGAVVSTDTSLTYSPTDSGAGSTPSIANVAFSNDRAGATSTTLFDVDIARDVLTVQNPINGGLLSTVGPLGFDAGATSGFGTFDGFAISAPTGIGYLTDSPAGTPPFLGGPSATTATLYSVNLATGAATSDGLISGLPFGRSIQDIAVVPAAVPEPATLGLIGAVGALAFGRRRRA